MAKKSYGKGRDAEIKIARSLRARGASVEVSKASRGAADLKVTFPTGTRWNVQVKSASRGTPPSPSSKDLGRLKQSATRSRATPVVAKVTPKSVSFISARSERKLSPPSRKRK